MNKLFSLLLFALLAADLALFASIVLAVLT
jgi:hypothetical protein